MKPYVAEENPSPTSYRKGPTTPNTVCAAATRPNITANATNARCRNASPRTRPAARRSIGDRRSAAGFPATPRRPELRRLRSAPPAPRTPVARTRTGMMKPPTAGAITGAEPHAAPSSPRTETSLAPRKQSAATVAANNRHVPAPRPCRKRNPIIIGRLSASAQPMLVSVINPSPANSTRLRPIASAISPAGNTTSAMPKHVGGDGVLHQGVGRREVLGDLGQRGSVDVEGDLFEGADQKQDADDSPGGGRAPLAQDLDLLAWQREGRASPAMRLASDSPSSVVTCGGVTSKLRRSGTGVVLVRTTAEKPISALCALCSRASAEAGIHRRGGRQVSGSGRPTSPGRRSSGRRTSRRR